MHIRVLAQINRGQMKPKHMHRLTQMAQAALHQRRAVVRIERFNHHVQIRRKRLRIRINLARHRRRGRGNHTAQAQSRGRHTRIHAHNRLAIRLIGAVRRLIPRPLRQLQQWLRHLHNGACQRQLAAQRVQLRQIMRQHAHRLGVRAIIQRVLIHKRIAIAVAANPHAHGERLQRLDLRRRCAQVLRSLFITRYQRRNPLQKSHRIITHRIVDFVRHIEFGRAQNRGLPQRLHQSL